MFPTARKGIYWTDFYRLVMEIEVQKLKNCRGLVASMAFLKKAAEQGAEHGVEEFTGEEKQELVVDMFFHVVL